MGEEVYKGERQTIFLALSSYKHYSLRHLK